MGRSGRFFGVLVVSTVAAAFTFLWRNKRARQRVQAIFAPAGDHIRDVIRRINRLRHAVATADFEPPQRPTITGFSAPECRPLTTVDEFLSWTPAADLDTPFCQTYNSPLLLPPPAGAPPRATSAAAPAAGGGGGVGAAAVAAEAGAAGSSAGAGSGSSSGTRGTSTTNGCRLLVCHDMMGGYLADRYVQGAGEQGFFRLWQWDQIDLFIYFSHHLITVPPPAWTAAAHRNGVRVLGTFITEWEEGRARCTRLFASRASARAAADRLVALAQHHGFEGWLINVENGLDRALVPNLQHFVAHLRARMAAEVPHGLVIWYDAITVEGRLAWQDGLTPRNAPFFDAADALFVNYKWQEGAPAAVAAAAGSRAADVFMGVDVFGRGSYGGGQDNCHVALAAARAGGVSAALFAPGWVYEEFDRSTFEPRQEGFWGKIREVWHSRPALVQRLPLVSCFNTGAGRGQWVGGRRVSVAPWWNLAAQDAVPTLTPMAAAGGGGGGGGQQVGPSAGAALSVRPTTQLAFSGGSCLALAVTPTTATTTVTAVTGTSSSSSTTTRRLGPNGPWVHGLYGTHLPVPHGGLELSYTVACTGSSRVALLLHFAREGHEGAGAAAAGAGAEAACGLAVGPWTTGDKATVESLRAAGFSCVCCTAVPSGATTSPLPELPLTSASLAPAPASSATSATSIPSGLPWLHCTARLPRAILPVAASGSGALVCAVSVVCYVAGGPAAAGGQLGGSAAAAAAAVGRSVAAALGQGSSASSYLAFLGCLILREHLPASPAAQHPTSSSPASATTATTSHQTGSIHLPPTASGPSASASGPAASAAAAVGPLGIPMTAPLPLAPPPGHLLTEARCSRVRWTRPGRSSPPPPPTDAAVAAGIAAAVAAASGGGAPSTAGLDSEDSWERSSAPAASPAAAAATGLHEPPVVLSGSDVADDEDEVEVQLGGGGTTAGSISGGNGGAAATARLLTCEISWAPQFDDVGMPVHRSYHVWVHFNGNGGNGSNGGAAAAAAAFTSGGPASPVPAALGTPGRGRGVTGTPSSPGPAGGWEVLQLKPDWAEGAVWVGEAFVARYRLVDLEVPVWASSVTLLVQGVGAACGQLQPLQAMATVPAPAAV